MLNWVHQIIEKQNSISSIIRIDSLTTGVNAELYKLITPQGEYVVRRSKEPINKSTLVDILQHEKVRVFLPLQHKIWLEDDYVYSLYQYVVGVPMVSFDDQAQYIFEFLESLHSTTNFSATKSIYHSILKEADFIHKNISEAAKDNISRAVRYAADRLLEGLNASKLNELLDNRGILTHGDFKPFNSIMTQGGVKLIDWDKACSICPEFEVAYAIFTGHIVSSNCKLSKNYNDKLLLLSFEYISEMYFVRDFYRYYTAGLYESYVKNEVFPMYQNFQNIKEKLKVLITNE